MAIYYVGLGGLDSNTGLSWVQRFLTLNGAEDEPVAAGDIVYVGAGVYREQLTCDVSGGNVYSTGTIGVTKGSKQVDGSGTSWSGSVAAAYMLHAAIEASGSDGVAAGTSTFTSAAGNFQSAMIGDNIQINARGAYKISAVASATSITLSDPHALGWPASGSGLTYSVMTGQGHYDIASVDDNTTIQLEQPWSGPTLTGIAYITFNPIRYIADVAGEHTDGIGGAVRVTGSNDDISSSRTYHFLVDDVSYRVFRGFATDITTNNGSSVYIDTGSHIVVEDFCFGTGGANGYQMRIATTGKNLTLRRCFFLPQYYYSVVIQNATALDDAGHLIENCIFKGGSTTVWRIDRHGGLTVRNNLYLGGTSGVVRMWAAPTVGQVMVVENCLFVSGNPAVQAQANGQIAEDFNSFYCCLTERALVATGASSVSYSPIAKLPIRHAGEGQISGFKLAKYFGHELSQYSALAQRTGHHEPNEDFYGLPRPSVAAKCSWGPIQYQGGERETTTYRAGAASIKLPDAGVVQFKVPVEAISTTISVYAYREASYAGTLPRMIIKQPGVADDVTVDTLAVSQWNLLTTTLTPAAGTDFVIVELQSLNTATSGSYATYFDTIAVS